MTADAPLTSRYANDPTLRPLLVDYVASLGASLTELAEVRRRGDIHELARLAHRLKGEAATYAYPELAAAIHRLEVAVGATPTPSSTQTDSLFDGIARCASRVKAGLLDGR